MFAVWYVFVGLMDVVAVGFGYFNECVLVQLILGLVELMCLVCFSY